MQLFVTSGLCVGPGSIQLRDTQTGRIDTLIERQGELGFYSPQPIQTRRREMLAPTQSDSATSTDAWATLLMQDVYQGLGPAVPRGEITQLAVVQEIEKPLGISPELRAFGFQFPVVSCGARSSMNR